jgi:hypothetical protein
MKSVKMLNHLDQTSNTAQILEDGRLKIDHYDFSQEAEDQFGNDVAFMIYISPEYKQNLLELLQKENQYNALGENTDDCLLDILSKKWDYHSFLTWIEKQNI